MRVHAYLYIPQLKYLLFDIPIIFMHGKMIYTFLKIFTVFLSGFTNVLNISDNFDVKYALLLYEYIHLYKRSKLEFNQINSNKLPICGQRRTVFYIIKNFT